MLRAARRVATYNCIRRDRITISVGEQYNGLSTGLFLLSRFHPFPFLWLDPFDFIPYSLSLTLEGMF